MYQNIIPGSKTIFPLLLFLAAIILINCNPSDKSWNMKMKQHIVKDFNLERYLGKWYEIARFPHSFEKNLSAVTATYSIMENGKIRVLNEGYKDSPNGKHKKAKATARQVDPSIPGWLKVYFIPFIGADYYILEIDKENYDYALVGSSSSKYLWILGRKPEMDPDVYDMLVEQAKSLGYDTSKLIKVEHKK